MDQSTALETKKKGELQSSKKEDELEVRGRTYSHAGLESCPESGNAHAILK